jgi:APA family basic amino acid/polyamine antiporter
MAEEKLERGLSLPMAIFIIIGMVIAASIWINPAEKLSETGPAIFLSYLIAAIPGIFIAYIAAYLGSAFPVAGGTYVVVSRLTGGFGGFMTVWMIILAVGTTLSYLGASFGFFLGQLIGVPADMMVLFSVIIGVIVLVIFYFLNWIRIEVSGAIELVITIFGDIFVMIIFIIAAVPGIKWGNFMPLFPEGFPPVLFTALTFYFSYVGFTLILEVAGEIKNPGRNIPRALLISIVFLVAIYTIQAFMVAGVQPYKESVGTVTELIAAQGLLPTVVIGIMAVLIITAIASTIHPTYMAFSRDIMMIAREQLFPKKLGKIHETQKTPRGALTLLLIVGIIFLVTFIPILSLFYSVYTAAVLLSAVTGVVVLILQIPVSLASIKLPKKFPEFHEKSGFKPSNRSLKIMGIIGAISSFIFVFLVFTDPDVGVVVALIAFPYIAIGALLYLIQKKRLEKAGIDYKETLKHLPEMLRVETKVESKIEKLAKEKETEKETEEK